MSLVFGGWCWSFLIFWLRTNIDDAWVAYHSLKDAPSEAQPGDFELTVKHPMMFVYEEPPVKTKGEKKLVNADHAGGLSTMWWEGLQMIWVVKWASNNNRGLMPVRPYLAAKQDMVIGPQQAISMQMSADPVA